MLTPAAASNVHHQLDSGQAGFAAFTSLVIVAAVVLSLAISMSLISVGDLQNSLTIKKGTEAAALAKSCAEEALLQLRASPTYTGGTLNFTDGSCTISTSSSGNVYTITATGSLSGPPSFQRTLEVTVKRTGQSIAILSWQEIP